MHREPSLSCQSPALGEALTSCYNGNRMGVRVSVLGNPVLDHVLAVEQLPVRPGEYQEVREYRVGPGGAANVLIAGARVGLAMQALGVVGDDQPGHDLVEWLHDEGIDTSLIIRLADSATPCIFILVAPDGSVSSIGRHRHRPGIALPEAWPAAIAASAALYCDGWAYGSLGGELLLTAAQCATAASVPVFFDPGPRSGQLPGEWLEEMLRHVTVLSLTEDEARAITPSGITDLETLVRHLQQRGPRWVVVKRGAQGCVIHDGVETVARPAFSVPVRDTTGAGDAAAAAIIFAWLRGYDPGTTATLANAAGALAVQQLGAGLHMPTANQIRRILETAGITGIV
jgi:ribokinase